MHSLAIGMTSGIGNCVYMLPTIKALSLMGYKVTLHVDSDFPTIDLWQRCIYAAEVIPAQATEGPAFCGPYAPKAWKPGTFTHMRLPSIHSCEWRSNFRIAQMRGWTGEPPDVSDWCDGLDRTPKYDLGIVPGCKGGTWLRKRYPAMKDIAAFYLAQGKSVAVFGTAGDGIEEIPGECVATPNLALLPDALDGCKMVIGTDSGVTHLASSLGIPVVMVYTGTSLVKAEPVGKNRRVVPVGLKCYPCVSTPRWQMCLDWKCRDIDPQRVIEAAEDIT